MAAILLGAVAGCGDVDLLRARYEAERLYWRAARAEVTARLRDQKPDSTHLLALGASYRAIGARVTFANPPSASRAARRLRGDVIHVVGTAELQAGRLALEANRPELALAACDRVDSLAEGDSLLARDAAFFRITALRDGGRYDEAIEAMQELLRRYSPMLMHEPALEDPLFAIPEAIVLLRRSMGDRQGMDQAIDDACDYYQAQLARDWPPEVEASVRARLIRLELERGDQDAALSNLKRLQALARSTSSLSEVEPEVRYYEAKILALQLGDRDPNAAVARLDAVTRDFPGSPFAARAAFDAGAFLERIGRLREAAERYRIVTTQFAGNSEEAPRAAFRRAILEDELGDWQLSKSLLDQIPLRYPESQAAVEAPMAVVDRYRRVGDADAAQTALQRAVSTYQLLLTRDTTSTYAAAYRWGAAQAQIAIGEWQGALETIDDMARANPGHPFTSQGLLRGSKLAEAHAAEGPRGGLSVAIPGIESRSSPGR